ncbi:hypothetical protein [Bartonella machadoae]|uniref:hypothetical protein n=1 Tax=Bartonella machadoae TaxID=2893471 RepID=UPI001F4CDB73|nr:hypothetical protein [Bartonella machadoae]UNE54892.1 hypothetical protein LNM86_03260 [Bartonella machadoae]
MVKLFNKYSLSVFIATAFFLSQVVNVHANYLSNSSQKEDTDCVIEQVTNVTYTTVDTTSLSVPAVSYETTNEAALEGKFEKVVDPITVGVGVLVFGYAFSFIIGLIKDIVSIFK